jgi:hypothetical protein
MINVLIIILMCNIFKGEKVKTKMMQCLESPIQRKLLRFDPFPNFYFYSTDKANDGKTVAPCLGLRGNFVGA